MIFVNRAGVIGTCVAEIVLPLDNEVGALYGTKDESISQETLSSLIINNSSSK